jgi:hypothetical protein
VYRNRRVIFRPADSLCRRDSPPHLTWQTASVSPPRHVDEGRRRDDQSEIESNLALENSIEA